MKKTTIISSTIAIAIIAALAGCSAEGATKDIFDTLPTAATTSTATATEAPAVDSEEDASAALKGVKVGAALTAEQAAAVQHAWKGDLKAYKTVDGKFLLLDTTAALPESVKADAGKRVTAAVEATEGAMDNGVESVAKSITFDTGKTAIVVVHLYTFLDDGEHQGWQWISTALGGLHKFTSSSQAVAASQVWIAKQADPAQYVVIVSQ